MSTPKIPSGTCELLEVDFSVVFYIQGIDSEEQVKKLAAKNNTVSWELTCEQVCRRHVQSKSVLRLDSWLFVASCRSCAENIESVKWQKKSIKAIQHTTSADTAVFPACGPSGYWPESRNQPLNPLLFWGVWRFLLAGLLPLVTTSLGPHTQCSSYKICRVRTKLTMGAWLIMADVIPVSIPTIFSCAANFHANLFPLRPKGSHGTCVPRQTSVAYE